jgi:hypothetical protein
MHSSSVRPTAQSLSFQWKRHVAALPIPERSEAPVIKSQHVGLRKASEQPPVSFWLTSSISDGMSIGSSGIAEKRPLVSPLLQATGGLQ